MAEDPLSPYHATPPYLLAALALLHCEVAWREDLKVELAH